MYYEMTNRDDVTIPTMPVFGYCMDTPLTPYLYRLANHHWLVNNDYKLLNQSGGANKFKQLRGAVTYDEYNIVKIDHLSYWRQLPWWLLIGLTKIKALCRMEVY